MYLLGVDAPGQLLLIRAETPTLDISITPDESGAGYVSFEHALSFQLATALDLQLRAANGSVIWRHIVTEEMRGTHGSGTVDLPEDLTPGSYSLEAITRRWPSVHSEVTQVIVKPKACRNIVGWWGHTDGKDITVVTQTGCNITASNAHRSWSPAFGTVKGNAVFMLGLTAQLRGNKILWTNSDVWIRQDETTASESKASPGQSRSEGVKGALKDAGQRVSPESTRDGPLLSTWHLLLAGLAGIAVVGAAAVVVVRCFLKVRHKKYGSIGGTIFYEPRIGVAGSKPEASRPPREMSPITMGSPDEASHLDDPSEDCI